MFCRLAAQSGARVAAVDADPAMVAPASRRVADCEFQVGGTEDLAYPNDCFDLFVCLDALEYAADPVNMLCAKASES